MQIDLTYENFLIYGDVINRLHRFEGARISEIKGDFLIGGKPALYYTFTVDYYFMIG